MRLILDIEIEKVIEAPTRCYYYEAVDTEGNVYRGNTPSAAAEQALRQLTKHLDSATLNS